jgi:hypothetical protein
LFGAAKIGFRRHFGEENKRFFEGVLECFVKAVLRFGRREFGPEVRLPI